MGSDSFCTQVRLFARLVFIITFAILFASAAQGQTKPERQSKAVKPSATAQTPQPAAQNAASTAGDAEAAESSKPEEKAFKGMKYRMVGPFRGGRSLTAAGIPGDPDDLLFRRNRRRSVEVDRRRHDLVSSFRQRGNGGYWQHRGGELRITTCFM